MDKLNQLQVSLLFIAASQDSNDSSAINVKHNFLTNKQNQGYKS